MEIEWITLTPKRGHRIGMGETVTMAWRNTSGKSGQPRAVFTMGASVMAELGWPKKSRFAVDYAQKAGLLLLRPPTEGETGWALGWKESCAAAPVMIPGVVSERRGTERVEHRIEAGALLITLPDWARPATQKPASAPQPVAAAVAPPAAPRLITGQLRSPEPSLLTPERADLFRVLWEDGVTTKAEIARLVNQTSPHVPPFQGKSAMNDIANRLGLPIDRSVYRPVEQLPPLPPMPESEPAPRPTRMGQHSLPTVHPMRAEAIECFAAGMGPRAVDDELGCGLSNAATWFAEWKAEQKGKAA